MNFELFIAILATSAFVFMLWKHIKFKRDFWLLKEEMKLHTLEHGVDDQLWDLFVQRSRKMLRFWQ